MSTTMSSFTHVQGKRHQRSLALLDEIDVQQNFIEKGSLPPLETPVSNTETPVNASAVYTLPKTVQWDPALRTPA